MFDEAAPASDQLLDNIRTDLSCSRIPRTEVSRSKQVRIGVDTDAAFGTGICADRAAGLHRT